MSNNPPTPLDAFFQKTVQQGGSSLPARPLINFLGSVSCADNPANNSTDVTISGGGSGGQYSVAVSNGLNSNLQTNGLTTIRLTTATGTFSIGGFALPGGAQPAAGALLLVENTTGESWSLVNEDSGSTPKYRVDTQRGADVILPAGPRGSAFFVYDAGDQAGVGRWVLHSIGQLPRSLNARDFGCYGNGTTDDTTAANACLAAAAALGAEAYFPYGTYVFSGNLTPGSGVRIVGDKASGASSLPGTIFQFSAGGIQINGVHNEIRDVLVVLGVSAGPALDFLATFNNAYHFFERLDIQNANTAVPMIRVGTTSSPSFLIGAQFKDCRWTHATGATQPGVLMVGDNGTLSNVRFQGIWCQSDLTATAPFFLLVGQSSENGPGGVTNANFQDLVIEQCIAGAIWLQSAQRCRISNVWIGDIAPNAPTGPMISFSKDATATYSVASSNIVVDTVQADSGTSTYGTVDFNGGVGGQAPFVLVSCKLPYVKCHGANPPFALGCNISGYDVAPVGWDGVNLTASNVAGATADFSGELQAGSAVVTGETTFNTALVPFAVEGLHGATSSYVSIYVGTNVGSESGSNYSLALGASSSILNGPLTLAAMAVKGTGYWYSYYADADGLQCNAANFPIVGNSSVNSPYGVHGYAAISCTSGGTIVPAASVYKNGILKLTGTASGGAVTIELPLGVYSKVIDNEVTGTVTIAPASGGGSSVVAAVGKQIIYCDGTNFF
jgi:hypothetical protein